LDPDAEESADMAEATTSQSVIYLLTPFEVQLLVTAEKLNGVGKIV
jgi:hypothetical protein